MDKNMKNIINIRNAILKLNDELSNYCSHESVSFNGYSNYYGGTVHICKNCGKLFISENIDDLIND